MQEGPHLGECALSMHAPSKDSSVAFKILKEGFPSLRRFTGSSTSLGYFILSLILLGLTFPIDCSVLLEKKPSDLMGTDLVSRLSQMDPTPVQAVGSIPSTWSPVWCLPQRLRRPS